MSNPRNSTARPSLPLSMRPAYLAAAVLSWLVPGAGFWILGYRVRALLLGASILGLFWTGESVLAGNMAVSRKVSPIFFCLQVGNGASTLASDRLWGAPKRPVYEINAIDLDLPQHINLGILCTVLSGLLNALLVLHVLDPRTWQTAREERAGPPGG